MEKVVVDLLRSCRGVALELEAGGVVGAPPHDRDLHGDTCIVTRQLDRNAQPVRLKTFSGTKNCTYCTTVLSKLKKSQD